MFDALQLCPLYVYVCLRMCCLLFVYMYVYIHCVFNIHCKFFYFLHFDVITKLKLFVCIVITLEGQWGWRSGAKCPLTIFVPNNCLVSQECVHVACDWANCVCVCVQRWFKRMVPIFLTGLLRKLHCLISAVQFAPIQCYQPVTLFALRNSRTPVDLTWNLNLPTGGFAQGIPWKANISRPFRVVRRCPLSRPCLSTTRSSARTAAITVNRRAHLYRAIFA